MNKHSARTRRLGWLAGAALALAACGGGGAGGGIEGTGGGGGGGVANGGLSYGTISAFGSVWVNGVEFSTSGTTIKRDDNAVTQADLRIGMVVRVDGSIDDKTAAAITVDDAIKGRVEQVLDASRMLVMGQTVLIDNQTRFENSVVPVAGDIVEVHGLPSADGTVTGGFIEKKAALSTPPFAVKGFVKNHDSVARTFAVGALTVNYGAATATDMPSTSWNGLVVDVKGSACAGNPVCGTLTASKVERGGAVVADVAKAEVEGFVSALSANGFVLGSQSVVTNAGTVFDGGLASEVLLGTKLEVEGTISGGVLTASKVSFRDGVRLEANVASVNAGAGTLTLAGLPGVTVQVNALTQLKNVASLSQLAAPNHLRIKARQGSGNNVLALELELRSTASDVRVILQGPVGTVTGTSSLTLLGVPVDTGAVADSDFKNLAGSPIGRSAFFAAATPGTLVKARGDLAGAAVGWKEMELER